MKITFLCITLVITVLSAQVLAKTTVKHSPEDEKDHPEVNAGEKDEDQKRTLDARRKR